MKASSGPLVVFGPASLRYDFGPGHPLTPRRFGPGIDLLRHVGAEPGLAPVPATDDALVRLHRPEYVATVRRLGADPAAAGSMGIGISDNPAFAGMHEAAATVAGGSLAAIDAVLRGDVEHAYHPGGGLHHAMPARASGFCIYDDPALAVVRARDEGLRVLYVDLDVHHGDGVQAMTLDDPGTLTLSLHESGEYLFPGTGSSDELGDGAAAGTSVNLPLEPGTGETSWLAAVRALLPTLAAVFGPDVVVSQHGADSHAWDPLAHLRVTTTAMAEAARLVDAVAHRWAAGRWLATGGGGYDAYRVVPRAWALTWLAGAHREPPDTTPATWRDRWAGDAAAFGTPGMPAAFPDAPNAGREVEPQQRAAEAGSLAALAGVRAVVLPRLVREAEDRGWWRPVLSWAGAAIPAGGAPALPLPATGAPTVPLPFPAGPRAVAAPDPALVPVVRPIGVEDLARLALAPRVVSPFDPADARALLAGGLRDGARAVAATSGSTVVGLAVAAPSVTEPGVESLLAVGVAPAFRGAGLGRALLRALVDGRPANMPMEAVIGVAERDVVDPAPVTDRIEAARRLLAGAGFEPAVVPPEVSRVDRRAIAARLERG